ncbi:hypothetical protein FJT64_019632 [Amphibalanus amphitrite]|uniref:Uncharacterized protein n=1 Tax=Amphibalanus amphitrite TaxID=1232801 RepID=A0A6A4X4F3_AMPAM|nr:hypothetical protein FJT64_019632 [Amphibalanus amphitrite]
MAERDAVRKLEAGLRGEADHVSFVPHCILELLDLREYAEEDEQGREQLIARQLATVGRGLQNDPEAQRWLRPDTDGLCSECGAEENTEHVICDCQAVTRLRDQAEGDPMIGLPHIAGQQKKKKKLATIGRNHQNDPEAQSPQPASIMAERDAVRKLEAGLRGEADHVSFVPHCILELLDLREYAEEDEQGREQLIARQLATVGRGLQNDPEAQRWLRPDTDGLCSECGAEENTEHVICDCPRYQAARSRILRVSAEVLAARWATYRAWLDSDGGAAQMLRACLGPSPFGFWLNDALRCDLAAAAARLSPLPGRQAALEAEIFAADTLLAEERAHAAAAAAELRASAAEVVWLRDRQQEAETRAAYIARLHEEADRRAGAAEAELVVLRVECGGVQRTLRTESRAHELCAAEYTRLRAATKKPELQAIAR